MSYVRDLVDSNLKSLKDMLKASIGEAVIAEQDIQKALISEAQPVPAGGDIYQLTDVSLKLLGRLQSSKDKDMIIIVKKILRSTKYAATTWYSVTGYDNNPHKLPIIPFVGGEQPQSDGPTT